MILSGFTQKEISEYYGCGQMTINNLVKRNTYKEVEIPEQLLKNVETYLKDRKHGRKLNCEQVCQIRQKHSEGAKQKDLAEEFDVSKYAIHDIVNLKSYMQCLN